MEALETTIYLWCYAISPQQQHNSPSNCNINQKVRISRNHNMSSSKNGIGNLMIEHVMIGFIMSHMQRDYHGSRDFVTFTGPHLIHKIM